MILSEVVSSLPMAGLWAAIGGLATQYLVPPVMQKLSGFALISRNAGNIERATKDYVSQMHIALDTLPDPQTFRSIFVANGENASIMVNRDGKRERASVRLDNEAGRWLLFQAKRNIDNPEAILSLFQTQVTRETLDTPEPTTFRGERKIWVRPAAPLERFAGFFTINVWTIPRQRSASPWTC